LVNYVQHKLHADWSPEQIAGRLREQFPGDLEMRISVEGIYRWIYLEARIGGTLYRHLRRQHKRRRRQTRYGTGRRFRPDHIRISQRPAIVQERQRYGDWEGDTMHGCPSGGAVATLVDRKSRFLLAGRLADKRSGTFTGCSVGLLCSLSPDLRHTLTLDNGSEGAGFQSIEEQARVRVYFADPYAAWQRGTNENTNGLLRQYFPKGTDLSMHSAEEIAAVAAALNAWPRSGQLTRVTSGSRSHK
jgi:IS30 family transposase